MCWRHGKSPTLKERDEFLRPQGVDEDSLMPMPADELKALIATRNDWFHTIDFGHGLRSPGTCPWEHQQDFLRYVGLPQRLDGKRVLDIGTYDGFFAFECERRGAEKVVAIDVHPIDQRCFKIAHDLLGSSVEYHHLSVY